MEKLSVEEWFEHHKPDEETTTICIDGYIQVVESNEQMNNLLVMTEPEHSFLHSLHRKSNQVCEAFELLAKYEIAEKQGLLWKVPCKVGDYVYQIDRTNRKINTHKVAKIELEIMGSNKSIMRVVFETAGQCLSEHFGNTVFLNKNDACLALEEYLRRCKP